MTGHPLSVGCRALTATALKREAVALDPRAGSKVARDWKAEVDRHAMQPSVEVGSKALRHAPDQGVSFVLPCFGMPSRRGCRVESAARCAG